MKKWILALAALLLAASALPAFAQVVLTGSFGQSAEMLSYEEEGDGAYTQTLLTDSGALIATGRAAPRPGLNDTLEAALNERYGDAGDVQTLEMPPVAGYPAQRARLRHGEGAEAQIVDYIYIPTDEWIFFAEIRVPADAEAELDELREIWVGSIDLFDDGLPAPDANAEADAADEVVEAAAPLSWEELATYVILTDEGDTVSDLVEMFAPAPGARLRGRDAHAASRRLPRGCGRPGFGAVRGRPGRRLRFRGGALAGRGLPPLSPARPLPGRIHGGGRDRLRRR